MSATDLNLDDGNDHRAAAKDIGSKSREARDSVCIILLSRALTTHLTIT